MFVSGGGCAPCSFQKCPAGLHWINTALACRNKYVSMNYHMSLSVPENRKKTLLGFRGGCISGEGGGCRMWPWFTRMQRAGWTCRVVYFWWTDKGGSAWNLEPREGARSRVWRHVQECAWARGRFGAERGLELWAELLLRQDTKDEGQSQQDVWERGGGFCLHPHFLWAHHSRRANSKSGERGGFSRSTACTSVRYQRNVNMLLGGNGLASKCDPDLVYLHLNIYLNWICECAYARCQITWFMFTSTKYRKMYTHTF